MPKKQSPLESLGNIWEGSDTFAAHVQFRSVDGQKQHIYGPQRATQKAAEADLASIRAYGPLFENDRDGGLPATRRSPEDQGTCGLRVRNQDGHATRGEGN